MGLVWGIFFVEILGLYFLHQFFECTIIYIGLIALNSSFILLTAVKLKKYAGFPFVVAYMVRLAALLFDDWTSFLTNMNGDIEAYYKAAIQFSENPSAPSSYGGMYSKVLGVIFQFTGPSKLMGAYINLLLGMSTIYLVVKVLEKIQIKQKSKTIILYWIGLFPYSIYNSSVVYRETIISFLFTVSCYFAIQWFSKQNMKYMLLCLAPAAATALFHAGSIVFMLGYFFVFMFYVPSKHAFVIRKDSVATFAVIVVVIGVVVLNPNLFLGKFLGAMQDSDAIVQQFNRNTGGSAYLSWLQVSSVPQAILWSPLKAFYFMFSPIPFDWRNIVDAVTFLIDSMSYLYLLTFIVRHMKTSKYSFLLIGSFIGVLAAAFVFGMGTWTAGTAIRHRNKIFAVILIMYALSMVKQDKDGVNTMYPSKALNAQPDGKS